MVVAAKRSAQITTARVIRILGYDVTSLRLVFTKVLANVQTAKSETWSYSRQVTGFAASQAHGPEPFFPPSDQSQLKFLPLELLFGGSQSPQFFEPVLNEDHLCHRIRRAVAEFRHQEVLAVGRDIPRVTWGTL